MILYTIFSKVEYLVFNCINSIQILNVLTQAAQTRLYLVGGSLVWRINNFIFSTRR
jgi:hypothetical protein